MWTRAELKARAKQAFHRNYWSCVVVAFVMSIITSAASSTTEKNSEEALNVSGGYGNPGLAAAMIAIFAIAAIIMIIAIILKIVIGNALFVGGARFFIANQIEKAKIGELAFGFKCGGFGNIVLVMFLRDLFTGLWTLLFIIPGIIKHYEYLMVPYILAENPQMSQKEVFQISKQMMMGQKMDAFVLELSFIGWRILEGITMGIVGIFYVEPYYQATFAELYTANKSIAYQNGFIR